MIMSEINSPINRQATTSGLQRIWDQLTAPSKDITDFSEQRAARLAASFLFAIAALDFVGGLARMPRVGFVESFAGPIGYSFIVLFIAYLIARTKWYRGAVFLFAIAFSSLAYVAMITEGNDVDYGAQVLIYVPLSLIVASSFLSAPAVFLLVGLNVGAFLSVQAFGVELPKNIGAQAGMITVMGVVLMLLTNFRNNTEKIRLEEVNETNRELESLTTGLEQRVAERTKALETSAEISRRLTSILDPRDLAKAVVTQVQSAYDYYYAQIYLFDEAGENLVLTSGTGEAGAEMMKRGHSLAKGRGLVGRAAENNESILVSDTSQDPNWLPNELLPNTKAEAVVPISIGDQVFGVLDVQEDITGEITPEDVILLESLAGQVAISLNNARQYAESQQFRLGIENSGDAVFATDVRGKITYANPGFEKVYGYSPDEVIGKNPRIIKSGLLSQENYEQFWAALLSKQSVTGDIVNKHKDGHLVYIAGTNSAIVNDAGDIVGFLAVHHDITEQKSSQDLISQRARQQEAINAITQRIQSATTIEEAMQVAARELGHALGQKQTAVALEPSALGSNGTK
jgi:PAS domain S-box-containing protein